MLRVAVLLLLLGGAPAAGDEAGDPIRELLEGLRSERIEEREAAGRKLFEAGPSALPGLRHAARDSDPDVARRAAVLARRVEAARLLGPSLLRRLPEAETLLASSRDHDWTRAFRDVAGLPGLRRAALDALAPRALAGALAALEDPEDPGGHVRRSWSRHRSPDPLDELREVAGLAAEWRLPSAVPLLRPWLRHADADIREIAVLVLGHLDAPEIRPDLFRLLEDDAPGCRAAAALVLGIRGSAEAVPALVRALTDDASDVRIRALQALRQLDARAATEEIERLLARDACPGRGNLIHALERLRLGVASSERSVLDSEKMVDADLHTARILIDRQRPDAVARILPLLKDARPGVRSGALSVLQDLRAREAVESIRPLLGDPVPELRADAVGALAELGGASAVDEILPLLRDRDAGLQGRAIVALGKFGDPKALPELRRLLELGDPWQRKAIAWAMKDLGSPDAVPALVRALDDPDDDVREAAGQAILKLSPACAFRQIAVLFGEGAGFSLRDGDIDPTQLPVILSEAREAIRGSDPVLRKGAMTIAYRLHLKELLPDLHALVRDPDPELRYDAVETIVSFNRRASLGSLLSLINDDHGKIRTMAAWGACNVGSRDEVLPHLVGVIEKRGIDEPLLSALSTIQTRGAVSRFTEALRHHDAKIRAAALNSLVALRAESSAAAILPLLEDPDEDLRPPAIRALGTLGAREAIPALRKALHAPESDVQAASIWALAALRAVDAAPDIEDFLDHDDGRVRRSAAVALGQLGARTALPRLRRLLEDPDFHVRQGAARALGLLGAREALPELLELLRCSEASGESPDGAVDALATLQAREALPDLLRLLLRHVRSQGDPNSVVDALRRLDPGAAGAVLIDYLERGVFTPHFIDGALQRLTRENRERRGRCFADPPPSPPRLAIQAIVDLGCREAIPTLRRLSREAEQPIRGEAIRGLAALSSRDSAAELIPLLAAAPEDVQAAVAARLGALDCREALPALRLYLRDPKPMLRLCVASACARLGGPDVRSELRPLLDDPCCWVRTGVAAALCRSGDRSGLALLIQEGIQLESLNALRGPAAWQRLAGRALTGPLVGDLRQVLAMVAGEAGLSLELPDDFDAGDANQRFSPDRFPSVLDLLLSLDDATFVLEGNRLQFLRRGDAWKFWDTWAAGLK